MSLTNACFENVIGLSRTDCECFGTPPDGFDESASGIYIDQAPGLNLEKIFAAAGCSSTGWDILTAAREAGLLKMKSEVLQGVQVRTKTHRPAGKSVIGKETGKKAVNLTKTYHGVNVQFASVRGGTATISRIGAAFKFTGSVEVSVYDKFDDTPIATRTISAVQNKFAWTTIEPIEVDLGAYDADEQRLWFLFEPTDGQQALDQKIASCGCTGKPRWDVTRPNYRGAVVQDQQQWTAWAMASGTYGNDLSERENWSCVNESQGLALDVTFSCDANTLMCFGEPDYQGDQVQRSFAVGVQLFAALDAIAQATGSNRVVRDAIAGGDETELTRVSLMKDAEEVVGFVVEMLSRDPDDGNPRSGVNLYSDCFTCKNDGPIVKTMRR